MKTRTSWQAGRAIGAGRRVGSRNRIRSECRVLVARMEKAGELTPPAWFLRLQRIALDETAKPGESILACRTLLEFRFGRPSVELDVSIEHSAPSIVELLESIARSPRHREALEAREQRQLAAVEIQTVKEKPA